MNRGDQLFIERYVYCLCVPVKPATLFYGSINFITYSLYIILVISNFGISNHSTNEIYDLRHQYYHRSTTTSLRLTMYLFNTVVSAMLIFGVIKSRASYLMPFFGVQLFEFFFALPTFLQSLYSHNHWDNDGRPDEWPLRSSLSSSSSSISPSSASFSSLPLMFDNSKLLPPFFRLSYLCLQGFFLCVIWKCYRYLKIREIMLPINFASNVESAFATTLVSSSVSMPPPDYDSVTKSSPPPDYESAIRSITQTTVLKQEESQTGTNVAATNVTTSNTTITTDDVMVKVEQNENEATNGESNSKTNSDHLSQKQKSTETTVRSEDETQTKH